MSHPHPTQTLIDAFNALADEVQSLTDSRTVLEHKLRFAHEQLQYFADKHAPAAPEIAQTLAKLHIPPHSSADRTSAVALPHRGERASQHQIALLIRDGRRAANQLASLGEASKTTGSTRDSLSHASQEGTSMSTVLEQDFTVEGKKGNLQCPFSKPRTGDDGHGTEAVAQDEQRSEAHGSSSDPICAAIDDASTGQQAAANDPTKASKCPIRYMDKHSPEEIAHYVETHKHELPRSHEVCLRRYQRSEEQIRKLDSKYGNLVSMIEGLGQVHQPMMQEHVAEEDQQEQSNVDGSSNQRVENWAKAISETTDPERHDTVSPDEEDRESRFDRPLKEIRVGESPSRPWGISVPVYKTTDDDQDRPVSPPPAPVRMSQHVPEQSTPLKAGLKCPIDHTKFASIGAARDPSKLEAHGHPFTPPQAAHFASPNPAAAAPPPTTTQPAFINPDTAKAATGMPQMLFTGPVFIGYPIEQAIQFLNQYKGPQ